MRLPRTVSFLTKKSRLTRPPPPSRLNISAVAVKVDKLPLPTSLSVSAHRLATLLHYNLRLWRKLCPSARSSLINFKVTVVAFCKLPSFYLAPSPSPCEVQQLLLIFICHSILFSWSRSGALKNLIRETSVDRTE